MFGGHLPHARAELIGNMRLLGDVPVERETTLETTVKDRIRNSLPMGDLPDNPNSFLTKWTVHCKLKISRSTYYKDLDAHEELRERAGRLFGKVKKPPIPKGEREIFQ